MLSNGQIVKTFVPTFLLLLYRGFQEGIINNEKYENLRFILKVHLIWLGKSLQSPQFSSFFIIKDKWQPWT